MARRRSGGGSGAVGVAWLVLLLGCCFSSSIWPAGRIFAAADTDPGDLNVLNTLFTSLNSPGQLKGWQANGGDPCGESWQGVTCSGSGVTKIILSNLGLTGNLAYNMNNLGSLTELDMSQNSLGGGNQIQYNLPNMKLEKLNLAGNQFGGNLPYSISTMPNLKYLNLNHNQLQGNITDVFSSLYSLTDLDLSFNSLTGDLPQSFTGLSSLKNLYLQNNQFTGYINVLANLPLDTLNVANNRFTGWIPSQLKKINSIQTSATAASIYSSSSSKPSEWPRRKRKASVEEHFEQHQPFTSFSNEVKDMKPIDESTAVLAIKKLDSTVMPFQSSDDFAELVSNISKLHHPNLNELVGYYEYSKPLSWNSRVKIALGSARALEYLHEICSPSIIHKNFKSSNILLDSEFNPHLSDAGLASFIPDAEFQAGEQSVGYTAPEVDMTGQYTLKSDVYSFGVVMLELLTGRRPFDSSRPRSEQSLVRWATPQLHDIDALDRMVDPALKGLYPAKSLSRFADVLALCVQPEPEFRPPMSEVVQALVRLVQRANMTKRMLDGDTSRRPDDQDQDFI
nr:unnamed protein product [Digitaria exilis]